MEPGYTRRSHWLSRHARNGPCMHKSVLLTEFLGKRKRQMDLAWGNENDLGPESDHMTLTTEALAHPRFVSGIFGYHRLLTQGSRFLCSELPAGVASAERTAHQLR